MEKYAESVDMQWRNGAYVIDTSRERLDLEIVARWLQATYWARERTTEEVFRSWRASGIGFGLFEENRTVGCARVVTDFVAIAYLADVYIVPELRGKRLGIWLVETIANHPDLASVGWLLHTRDMHSLYRKVGFVEPGPRVLERPRH